MSKFTNSLSQRDKISGLVQLRALNQMSPFKVQGLDQKSLKQTESERRLSETLLKLRIQIITKNSKFQKLERYPS